MQIPVACSTQKSTQLYLMNDVWMERMVGQPENKASHMSHTKCSCAGVNLCGFSTAQHCHNRVVRRQR